LWFLCLESTRIRYAISRTYGYKTGHRKTRRWNKNKQVGPVYLDRELYKAKTRLSTYGHGEVNLLAAVESHSWLNGIQ
jgi:hypothetical protein